jgi:flagellar M-ring protein FliF
MEKIIEMIKKIGIKKLSLIVGCSVVFIITIVFTILTITKPVMGVLFSDIEPNEGGKIIEKLKSLSLHYEVDGHKILIPKDDVARIRMELAQDGLPNGHTVGFELFEKTDVLGVTNNLFDINYTRALEGELSRSIKTIQGILSVRVHLVLPKRELFSRDKVTPSASVVIRQKPGAHLSMEKVQAIQHLIASSVQGMSFDQVAVIDDKGGLLAKGMNQTQKISEHFKYQQDMRTQVETKLIHSVESLLAKIVDQDQYRVEIIADLDFDQLSSTSIIYDPDGQVIKHSQSSEEGNDSLDPKIDTVTIQNNLPHYQPHHKKTSDTHTQNTSANIQEDLDYEISNTTKNYVKEIGAIKYLSVAVMIDGIYQKTANGDMEYIPRSQSDLDKIKQLIKTAVGFKDDRGDMISVIDIPFKKDALIHTPITAAPFPWFRMMEILIVCAAIIGASLLIIRPVLVHLFATKSEEKEESSVNKVKTIVETEPNQAVSVLRQWMNSSPPQT